MAENDQNVTLYARSFRHVKLCAHFYLGDQTTRHFKFGLGSLLVFQSLISQTETIGRHENYFRPYMLCPIFFLNE